MWGLCAKSQLSVEGDSGYSHLDGLQPPTPKGVG